ncbi:MAG: hypothetical protein RML35_01035 [Chloroherpetonaceae bacterium]|nr:hypothetical protein [Chloroherpetonaceae bacterium]
MICNKKDKIFLLQIASAAKLTVLAESKCRRIVLDRAGRCFWQMLFAAAWGLNQASQDAHTLLDVEGVLVELAYILALPALMLTYRIPMHHSAISLRHIP